MALMKKAIIATIKATKITDATKWVTPDLCRKIIAVASKTRAGSIDEMDEHLDGQVERDDIEIVLECYVNQHNRKHLPNQPYVWVVDNLPDRPYIEVSAAAKKSKTTKPRKKQPTKHKKTSYTSNSYSPSTTKDALYLKQKLSKWI